MHSGKTPRQNGTVVYDASAPDPYNPDPEWSGSIDQGQAYVPNYRYTPISQASVPAHGILSAPPSGEADQVSYSQFSTPRDAKLAAKLVADKVAAERERCARVAIAEKVDFEATGDSTDEAYNAACDDIAAAIRASK